MLYQGCLKLKKKKKAVTLVWAFESTELMSLGFTAVSSKLGFCLMNALKHSSDALN